MRNYTNRQQGGTVLGIIIGLVVGLGIALAVAVAITKTPMPFTNRMGKPERASDPNAGKSDPNRTLYGNRAAAKEAAKDFAKEPENSAAPAADKKPEPKAAVVELPPTDKPKKAEARTADTATPEGKDTTAKTENAEEKWSYFLQAGAFREQTDAENTRAKLALMGVEARISERQSENGVLYRVRVGPFAQLEAMNRVRGKLSDNGVDAAVVRISK